MDFIKKIAEGKIDDAVHLQFTKFSKGEFRNRALINAKQSKGHYTINTGPEFANDLVMEVAKEVGDNKVKVSGVIVSTSNLSNKLDYKEVKQFQGVKKYIIDKEMTGEDIINLLYEFPKAFFALSFNSSKTNLKIKPKMPTSGKSGKNSKEGPKADFCKIVTNNSELAGSFIFENPNFQKAEVNHTYIIEKIIIPDSIKNEKDYAKIREMSRRRGRVVRIANIDGKEIKREIEFEA
ncbi:MAG TPA: hypothetical protein VJH65_01610 [Candidatus Nanoarchaeia archaeon]|nr:hypothetical protein [Candidatus Nanoarchaeia archaeon]